MSSLFLLDKIHYFYLFGYTCLDVNHYLLLVWLNKEFKIVRLYVIIA